MLSPPDVDAAVDAIRGWGERCAWSGWDPYDALNSPFAEALTLGTPLGRRLLTQAVKRSPVNLRPALRVPQSRNAKAIGLVVSGYAQLACARGDETARRAAEGLLDWLLAARLRTGNGAGWGYHFDVQTRFFHYRRDQPNVVATAFAAHALLDAVELLDATGLDEPLLETVRFLSHDLLRPGRRPYFRYVDEEDELVHNANLLACAVIVRVASALRKPALAEAVEEPLATTLAAQAPDGSWPYSARVGGGWVDNFHTGYVLESLAACADGRPAVERALDRGLSYWERALFTPDGSPRSTTRSTYPLDGHSYAQAVETWLAVADRRADAVRMAEHAAGLLIDRMLAADGHVYFEQRRLWLNRTPFVRWTTAPAFRALARLVLVRATATEREHARLG